MESFVLISPIKRFYKYIWIRIQLGSINGKKVASAWCHQPSVQSNAVPTKLNHDSSKKCKLALRTNSHEVNCIEFSSSCHCNLSVSACLDPISIYFNLGVLVSMCITLHLPAMNFICYVVTHSLSLKRSYWTASQYALVFTILNNFIC